jgi:hypothetical protein
MKTCDAIVPLLGMLTLVAVTRGSEPSGASKVVVGPEWKTAEEIVDLPTGMKARATYHFNRNALLAACVTEDGIVAATDSGNLLKFDSKDLRLQQEIRPAAAIALLTKVEGVGILAADTDGRVHRIDPNTLAQTEITKLPGAPQWMVGFHDTRTQKNGVLAAVALPSKETEGEQVELHKFGLERAGSEKLPFPVVKGKISAYFLDRNARLWLGVDAGEWGGWCGSFDLRAGNAARIEPLKGSSPPGVYGFVELPDGQVWAYGGTMHFLSSGFIARVDRGKLEMLARFGDDPEVKPSAPQKLPRYPITHIIADPKSNDLLVFAYLDLFRVDAQLKNWRHVGTVDLRYRWGRPDAMGSYPALRTVSAIGNQSGDLICATALDGLLRIREGQVTQYVVPDQIGDDRIDRILPAAGTSLLVGEQVWRHAGTGWQALSLFPSAPPSQFEKWREFGVMLDRDRVPVALCRTNSMPGAAALTRWKDGKVEVIASEGGRSPVGAVEEGFATPDGAFWCAGPNRLLRLVDGRWQQVGEAPDEFLWGLHVVGPAQPPWVLHCKDRLYRLTPGKGVADAALTPIPLPAELGEVHDGLALAPGQILLACKAGLRLFDEKSGKVSECPFPPPQGEVWALCHDGRGRTWLAGRSVWMVDAERKVHDLGKLARFGAVAHAIGADSMDAAGTIVALGKRGILFVRAADVGR